MKILVFGGSGMIGHQIFRHLQENHFSVFATLRHSFAKYEKYPLFNSKNSFEKIDIVDSEKVSQLLESLKPDCILNCVGITLRKLEIKDEAYCLKINAEFPHFLKKWCEKNNSYLIHFSTDCVFSGKSASYTEQSPCDATDIYGRTKSKGEVTESPYALTLRSSMVGRELFDKTELLEWALSQKNQTIQGYERAIYSGVTTSVMAKLILSILKQPQKLIGLYQVSSNPISKFQLLQLINSAFKLNMQIVANHSYVSEKILLSEKLKQKMNFQPPEWTEMLDEVAKDLFKYQ